MIYNQLQQLDWSLGDLLYHIFHHDGSRTPGRSIRNSMAVSRLLKGQTTVRFGTIIKLVYTHPLGYSSTDTTRFHLEDYALLNTSVRVLLRSFAVQVVRDEVVKEARTVVLAQHGLHASLMKNSRYRVETSNVGDNTLARVESILRSKCPASWIILNAIAGDSSEGLESLEGVHSKNTALSEVISHSLSSLLFTRNREARLLPLSLGILGFGYSVSADFMAYLCRIGMVPAFSTILRALKVLGVHSKSILVDRVLDPTKCGNMQFDNVQNFHRIRDLRIGSANKLNIGLAAIYFELEGVSASALSVKRRQELVSLNKRQHLSTDTLLSLINHNHLDEVITFHWLRVLINAIPQLSHWKGHVSTLFATRAARLRLPAKPTPVHCLSSSSKSETNTTELKDALLDFLQQMGVKEDGDTASHEKIILTGGDGLTFQRVQEVQRYLQFHPNPVANLSLLEPVLSMWHTEWTDMTRIFHLFLDSVHNPDPSSLGHSASKIGRASKLSTDKKVDFYLGSELLKLITDARMLDIWRNYFKCKDIFKHFESLDSKEMPDIQELETIARRLHQHFSTTPAAYDALGDTMSPSEWSKVVPLGSPWRGFTSSVTEKQAEDSPKSPPSPRHQNGDRVLSNAIFFLRDSLLSYEFAYAVAEGDPGRVYEVLKVMLFTFAGSTHSKYATYLLETIARLELESTSEMKEAILKSTLVNLTGREGSFAAADFIQEYFNRLLEAVVEHKGVDYGSDFIRNVVSPNLHFLARIKADMRSGISLGARSGRHTVPHQDPELKILLDLYQHHELHRRRPGRVYGHERDILRDHFDAGVKKLHEEKLEKWVHDTTTTRNLLHVASSSYSENNLSPLDKEYVPQAESLGLTEIVGGQLVLGIS
ncbi:hypothetical protein BJ165DRAFT_1339856 [Panaeolus papilionaceus]|nr:hypothetical protein BJ165DRAFT_1339856 [Panaeolus papilionaceus]